MGTQVDSALVRHGEPKHNAGPGCRQCGWWDLAMKYGGAQKCTRCGSSMREPDAAPKN